MDVTSIRQQRRTTLSISVIIDDQAVGTPRKIIKIISYRSGGFAVVLPYHGARCGYLVKQRLDYRNDELRISREEMEEYSASDRVKLSFHPDGFVQFSGENPGRILSGLDPDTGEPRGLGILLEHPLNIPIASGPTFGLSIWGLEDFATRDRGADQRAITLRDEDMYYRGCTPGTCNGYFIECFIFPEQYWAGVRKKRGELTLTLGALPFELGDAVLDFRISPLEHQSLLLGFLISRARLKFPSPSGFAITSPSDRRKGAPVAHALMATYPEVEWPHPPESKLDYTP